MSGTAYRIDGGPAIVDFQTFLADLDSAVGDVLASEEAFESFAVAVLAPDASEADKETLRQDVELWHLRFSTLIEESLPEPGWGPSRLDAISMIFNRLTGLDIGEPPDYIIRDNMRRADVPTRYPFLWNAPRQDRTQWLGFAANGNDLLALSRNLGQVYGVFGEFHPLPQSGTITNRDFLSDNSANFAGLRRIEELLEEMGPPRWPWQLDHQLVEEGKLIFQQDTADGGCVECHAIRSGKIRSPFHQSWATPIMDVGTDARACQLLARQADPGTLAGTRIHVPLVLDIEISQQPTEAIELLEAAVLGAILQDTVGTRPHSELVSMVEAEGAAEAEILPPEFESLRDAFPDADELPSATLTSETSGSGCAYESRVLEGVWAAAPYLHNGSVATLADLLRPSEERATSFAIGRDYDIEAVGLAAEQSRFDYVLETTDCSNLTSGNSRCGHEYGTGLSEEDRRAMIEYLKSL